MTVTLSLFAGAGAQFLDNNGNPLSGGKIYTYQAGTTTPLTTYTTNSGTIAHTNPIVLDAAGRVPSGGEIWLTLGVGYKFVVKTSTEVLIATYDNIPSSAQPPAANDADSIMYEQGYTVTAGSFVIGKMYRIATLGTTDFTLIGAVNNVVGTHFIATGVGTGTGTAELSQTVESKLRETVSVKDFGAVGDGVTDDTVAIQAAIDYVVTLGGGIVSYPAGSYKQGAVNLFSNVAVVGDNATLVPFGNPLALFLIATTGAEARTKIKIDNFIVDNGNTQHVVKISLADTSDVRGVEIENILVYSDNTITSVVDVYNNSSVWGPARINVTNVNLRYRTWPPKVDHVIKFSRGASAVAGDVSFDNCTFTQIFGVPADDLILIDTHADSFTFKKIYGGLYFQQAVIRINDDGGPKPHRFFNFEDIHAESWTPSARAVVIDNAKYSNFTRVFLLRIESNTNAPFQRTLEAKNVSNSTFSSLAIYGLGGAEIASGYYAGFTFDADCKDNFISMSQRDWLLRVNDSGQRNVFSGINIPAQKYVNCISNTTSGTTVSTITTIRSYTIKAGTVSLGQYVRAVASGNSTGTNTKRFGILFNDGTNRKVSDFWDTTSGAWRVEIDLNIAAAGSSQTASATRFWGGALAAANRTALTMDMSTNDVNVVFFIETLNSADSIVLDRFSVEIVPTTVA